MDHPTETLTGLFVAFVAALLGGEVAQRLRLPSVVGQIAAGVVVGPSVLVWLRASDSLSLLSELGAILLLFDVGLETRLHDLRKVGRTALAVGALGVVAPFALALGWALATRFPGRDAPFVAAAFVATSAGVTAKVLRDLGALRRPEAKIILAAAVIDDVLAMLVLGVASALRTDVGVDVVNLLKVTGGAVGFVAAVALLGTRVMRRSHGVLDAPLDSESPLPVSFAILLALAVASARFGLASIIGAFLAGMVLAETPHRSSLRHDFARVSAILVPFFFVATGAKVDVRQLANGPVLLSLAVVTALAIVGKVVGAGLAARGLGRAGALIVGVGMVPRGEVGIIVAGIGERAGVFSPTNYALIVGMSLLTSMLAPPVLGRLLRTAPPVEANA